MIQYNEIDNHCSRTRFLIICDKCGKELIVEISPSKALSCVAIEENKRLLNEKIHQASWITTGKQELFKAIGCKHYCPNCAEYGRVELGKESK